MPLTAGTRLGPYEILAPLGAGGMGEVYRARDTRLDRTVAVKVLPRDESCSPEVRQRFEREARAIAQLSHPHICALFDVGREGEIDYLVMELLEGETLAERLVKGPLPPGQTLSCGVEIAGALDRAHRQGIVHRDLKPGNVMLTKSGVKLLDFGLAKLRPTPEAPAASPLSALPTAGQPLTREGMIVGTFQYMAPEQLEGKDVDARTDIFAFGAVLYEMATGRKAFSGGSQASLISSIMQSDPPSISSIQPMSPPSLDRIVKTCLAKDPEERWQNAGDLAREIQWVARESGQGVAPTAARAGRPSRRERLAWALAALAVVFGAASLRLRRTEGPEDPIRFAIAPPSGQRFVGTVGLAPGGRRILFRLQDAGGRALLGIRPLDGLEIRRLPGTEESHNPFWSPDGREVAFFGQGKLKRVAADGGPVQTICEASLGIGGSWSPQGTALFPKDFGSPLFAVSVAGGTPRQVTSLDEASGEVAHVHPAFLPDGRHFVFVARNLDPEKTSVMLGTLDTRDVRRLFHADSAAIYTDPGYLLFARDNALFAWRFDPRSGALQGSAVPAFQGIRYGTEDNQLSASATGDRLVYLPWSQRKRLVWADRKGREVGALGGVGDYEDVRISPDGRRVAVAQRDPGRGQNLDVWLFDAARGTETRVTSERTDEFDPAWFPDGERLVYVSDHTGFYDLYERPADGGTEKVLMRTKQDKVAPIVSADGRWLYYTVLQGGNGNPARFVAPADGRGDARRLSAASLFAEQHAEISPDGRWAAFESTESGPQEIFVQPVSGGPRRQASAGGGQMPVWRRDGAELFYVARNGMLMSAAIRTAGGRLEIGEPQSLFPSELAAGGEAQLLRHPYDVAPGGERFLLIRRAPDAEPEDAVVVTNWTAALRSPR